ncbi:MAG: cysteine--tRNA ligase [Patescibacteria group bacterium]
MPRIKIYNSLSRKKEPLPKSPSGKPLRLFVCGPTVYDDAHIGHARTYIFFDFFAKYLRNLGHKVKYVQNITDIDDKIIQRAKQGEKEPLILAKEFTARYLADMRSIGINAIDDYAPATKFIPQIVAQVQTLIKKGYAYEISGDGWYYDISKFKEYGKLSGRTALQAEDAISRVDESIKKRNRGDFCLWKFTHANSAPPPAGSGNAKAPMRIIDGEPKWESPLGSGRPGWHIEDTAISEHYFGPQYEIHGGGLDLKFPHHEAEIAQQEAASGPPASEFARRRSRAGKKPFVQLWMHTGMVTVNGQKMSKGLRNFITIRDYLQNHSPEALRLAFFGCHYRSPADYSEKLIENSESALNGINEFYAKLDFSKKSHSGGKETANTSVYENEFNKALEDDINTPNALAAIFRVINDLNPKAWTLEGKSVSAAQKWLKSALHMFGIELKAPKIPAKIGKLAAEREKFRSNKQFMQSDALRKEINTLGYEVEDTPLGPFLWPRNSK